ncbi:MAG: diguanylate cyclase, partial [Treponema sp.]|nr:diguanylate cyclase [Treponema sp.]
GGKKLLLVLFRVENFIQVAEEHGFENANVNLKVTVDCLKEQFGERDLYRLSESIFAVFSPDLTINDAEEKIKAVKKFENNYNDNPNLIDIRTRCVIVEYDRESYRNLESFIGKAVKKVEADS